MDMKAATEEHAMLSIDKVCLSFPVRVQSSSSVKQSPTTLLRNLYIGRSSRQNKPILKNITLTIHEGERVALLGHNGAGKTTLLHLFAGVYKPSSGSYARHGEIHGIFNTSVGFQIEATGIENIYLRGFAMGLSSYEIQDILGQIIEFAALGDWIRQPIKTYSNGMRLRLAFSIATAIQPDILLMDEWLGAGDARFIKKAQLRLLDRVRDSRIMVLASHNVNTVRSLCSRGIVLQSGELVFDGPINDAIQFYQTEE